MARSVPRRRRSSRTCPSRVILAILLLIMTPRHWFDSLMSKNGLVSSFAPASLILALYNRSISCSSSYSAPPPFSSFFLLSLLRPRRLHLRRRRFAVQGNRMGRDETEWNITRRNGTDRTRTGRAWTRDASLRFREFRLLTSVSLYHGSTPCTRLC